MFKSMMVASVLGLVAAMGEVGIAAAPEDAASGLPNWRQLVDTPIGRLVSGNLGRLMTLRSELGVTPEQRAEIREVLVEHRSRIAATVQAVREKRLVLRDAVLADQPDEGKIRQAAADLGSALGDAAVKAAKLRGELAPVLTAKQRELIREFRDERDASIDEFLAKAIENE
jgi:Spy/CpxP family protein refolding chaperone